jgi:ubiquinone/menaquinone biosynthesis C-methylase UbiE
MIQKAVKMDGSPKNWVDLGSGSGIFTRALASLLSNQSVVLAVDKEQQRIDSPPVGARIHFLRLDFVQELLPFDKVDGILMANALHYVDDKQSFIEKLKRHLKDDGQFVIIEYDTESRNKWVPYPISFQRLKATFADHGFHKVEKVGERSSIYRANKMYACVVSYR